MAHLPHISVLHEELVAALNLCEGDIAIDCTVGAGGHTERMLQAVGQSGHVYGIDRDESALQIAASRMPDAIAAGRLILVHGRFSALASLVEQWKIAGQVQGICADIGVSSMHLDRADRGFSFMHKGPLDMRMDQSHGRTAADIVNQEDEAELTRIFRDLGEEPKARFVARRIVETRESSPILTTDALAQLVKSAIHYPAKSRKHPATKVFQALRIAVNEELQELNNMLADAFLALKPSGRLAIISFHSLEDRIVKTKFRDLSGKIKVQVPRGMPVPEPTRPIEAKIIKPFPLYPSDEELAQNPRSRSAKLRIVEKQERF